MPKAIPVKKLTQEKLKEILKYDHATGIFTWKIKVGRAIIGAKAGSVNSQGYIKIRIDGICYASHRLAWLYTEGYFPENCIDHINRNRSDNRIENLREASQSCNMRNTGLPSNNTSGVKGVTWNKATSKWRSSIKPNNKRIFLGYFDEFSEAVLSRWQAEINYGFIGCCSDSSSYKYLKENGLLT